MKNYFSADIINSTLHSLWYAVAPHHIIHELYRFVILYRIYPANHKTKQNLTPRKTRAFLESHWAFRSNKFSCSETSSLSLFSSFLISSVRADILVSSSVSCLMIFVYSVSITCWRVSKWSFTFLTDSSKLAILRLYIIAAYPLLKPPRYFMWTSYPLQIHLNPRVFYHKRFPFFIYTFSSTAGWLLAEKKIAYCLREVIVAHACITIT